jgi:hypothetical protein
MHRCFFQSHVLRGHTLNISGAMVSSIGSHKHRQPKDWRMLSAHWYHIDTYRVAVKWPCHDARSRLAATLPKELPNLSDLVDSSGLGNLLKLLPGWLILERCIYRWWCHQRRNPKNWMTVLFSVDLLYLVTTEKSKCCKVTVPDGSYYQLLSKKTMSDSVASYQTRPALTNSKHAARESKEAACSESRCSWSLLAWHYFPRTRFEDAT